MTKFSKWNYYVCNVVYLTSIMILFIYSVTHYQNGSNITTTPIIGTNLKEAFTEGYLTNKSFRDQKTIFKQEYGFTVQY